MLARVTVSLPLDFFKYPQPCLIGYGASQYLYVEVVYGEIIALSKKINAGTTKIGPRHEAVTLE